jgi:hypothetical protein
MSGNQKSISQLPTMSVTPSNQNIAALRAVITMVNEHLVDYEMKWAEGSAMIRSLLIVVAVGSICLLYCGLIPLICTCGNLRIMNWIVLGAAGSLMRVLLNLRNSDVTEVGNTAGRKEIWRTVSGGALGLIAGALVYSASISKLLPLLPDLESTDAKNMGGAVLWAVFSGFALESIVERVFSPLKSQSE